jgi:hypothetical protein
MNRRTIYTTPDLERAIAARTTKKNGDDVFNSVSEIIYTLIARHEAVLRSSLPCVPLSHWRLLLASIPAMQEWSSVRNRDPNILSGALDIVCSGQRADLLDLTGTTMTDACGLAGRLHRMPTVQLAAIHDVYERATVAGVHAKSPVEAITKIVGNGAILREEESTCSR